MSECVGDGPICELERDNMFIRNPPYLQAVPTFAVLVGYEGLKTPMRATVPLPGRSYLVHLAIMMGMNLMARRY